MAEQFTLSERDRDYFNQLVRDYVRQIRNIRGRENIFSDDYMTPEVYIAYVPTAGIPAMSTISGSTPLFLPGANDCNIYQIVGHETEVAGDAQLEIIDGLTHRVFNLSPLPVAGEQIVVIKRDKFGRWLIEPDTVLSDIDISGTGTGAVLACEDYKTECLNGFLYLLRCTLNEDGSFQWVVDHPLGIPCFPGGGSPPYPPLPPYIYPTALNLLSNVCPVIAACRSLTVGSHNILYSDTKIFGDATSGSVNLTLPTWRDGDIYLITKVDASGNAVVINAGTGQTINGTTSISIITQWQSIMIHTMCTSAAFYGRRSS